MATTPPLHGLRIIEASALGPAAITTALVDLGADVIKIEPPAGDYIREMTWPIVEGTSLMHLHLNRGKRSLVLDLRTEAGVGIMKELAATADVVVEAMRPGSLARRGVGYDELPRHQSTHRLLQHLGLRHVRALPGLPEPRRGLRHLGRDRERRHRRRGLLVHPRARLHRHQRRPALRRPRHPGRRHPRPCHRRELLHRPGPVRRRRGHGLVPLRELPRLRAAPVRGDREQGRQLRAPHAGHRRHGRGRALPGLRGRRRTLRPLHGLRAGLLEELLRGRRARRPVRALARLEVHGPRGGTGSSKHELRDIFRTKTAEEWLEFGGRVNTPIAPVNTPKTLLDDPQFADRLPLLPAAEMGADQLFTPLHFVGEELPHPAQAPTVGQHTEAVFRDVLGYDDNQITTARDGGAFGTDT